MDPHSTFLICLTPSWPIFSVAETARALNKSVAGTYSSQIFILISYKLERITEWDWRQAGLRCCDDRSQGKMKKSKAPSSRRAEIQHLHQCYALGQTTLPACALLRFLHKEQMELTANEETAESLIDRYEIEETGRWRESCLPCRAARCSLPCGKEK